MLDAIIKNPTDCLLSLFLLLIIQTSAISTRCDMWQDGVVAVTGHSNGTIALWGISYPSDIEREMQARRCENESAVNATLSPSQTDSSSTVSNSRAGGVRAAMRIGTEPRADGQAPRVVKVIPSCQLFIMKLLLDHRVSVTALTLGADQRQLLSGDADGNCIRWVDDSVSINIL